ncbi:OmpP1/FadL family transporter [Frigidibacter sp. ROC022]|uniref:OmpP1/FadL family transporter n=1 Tax=Frigidibacter sp. ROC022 TaxID=2971796 RepID=UPI00215AF9BB|nr:aromatic hydrocarbon degradation protein [Frigidibacter sp. ROC022]MCR8726337.1 aromatic hydrocarbon degradation protein [Frigidibacter sp. ROC022]
MKYFLHALAGMTLAAGAASAGGIDRSGQSIGALFEKGTYAELSFGYVSPSVTGNDLVGYGGAATGNVADPYAAFGLAYKQDLNDRLSLAFILDRPFGADVLYDPTSVMLGNTKAYAATTSATILGRYKMDRFSVHGGVRLQQARAFVHLEGAAYGGLSGYSVALDRNMALGYVIGAAYEIPDIALRVALTYNSAIEHDFDTVETLGAAVIGVTPTTVKTPQSVNLDFQTGVAADTLVFGQIRWVKWSEFRLDPATFIQSVPDGLINLHDTVTYTLGVGRKFNDTWSGAASITYEPATGDDLVSPLAPTNGKTGITLAAIYTKDNMKITTGINYTLLGDAFAETGTPDTARADFSGNSAVGIGVKIGFTF